jgi:hypothetical protein
MLLNLPAPVGRYFSAQQSRDLDAQVECFADDAFVHDEGRDYRGRSAIRAWKEAVQQKFLYEAEPRNASEVGNVVTVNVHLTGNFPGSPIDLVHTFTLSGDKISSLVIE